MYSTSYAKHENEEKGEEISDNRRNPEDSQLERAQHLRWNLWKYKREIQSKKYSIDSNYILDN